MLERSYLGSGASERNTAIIRSNYRTPAGRRLLRRVREALRADVGGPRAQRAVLPARPPDARPHRARHRRPAGPRRDEPAARASTRRVIDRDEIRRHGAGAGPQRPAAVPDPRGAVPPAGRDHPPRRRGVGLRAARRGAGRRHPPVHRGHRHRRRRRPGHRRPDDAGPDPDRHRRQRDGRLGVEHRRTWSGCGCRS